MSLDFNEFISLERHSKRMERGAQEVKDKYAMKPAETRRYLLELFDFFLSDIENAAEVIYTEVLHRKDRLGDKFNFTPPDLRACIEKGTTGLLPSYNRIPASYNMGGMFRDVDDFDKLMASFKEDAVALCSKQAEILETKYTKLLKNNRWQYWTFIGVMVGALTGIASLVGFKITLNLTTGFSFIKNAAQYLVSILC